MSHSCQRFEAQRRCVEHVRLAIGRERQQPHVLGAAVVDDPRSRRDQVGLVTRDCPVRIVGRRVANEENGIRRSAADDFFCAPVEVVPKVDHRANARKIADAERHEQKGGQSR